MGTALLGALAILLLVGLNHARPSKNASPDVVGETKEKSNNVADDASLWRPIEPKSSSVVKTDSRSDLKDLQYMDQSLRTVATQLLNVTKISDDSKGAGENNKVPDGDSLPANVLMTKKYDEKTNPSTTESSEKSNIHALRETNPGVSVRDNFGRPVNSKFGFFESSHPGQAMAMTEEELEKELMAVTSTRLMTAHKNYPTTTSGISTWILLNPPTTTSKTTDHEAGKIDDDEVKVQITSSTVEIVDAVTKENTKSASTFENLLASQSTTPMERIVTLAKNTTPSIKKTTSRPTITAEKGPKNATQVIPGAEKKKGPSSLPKTSPMSYSSSETMKLDATTPKSAAVPTRKNANRPSTKLAITTPKPTNVTSKPMTTKLARPSNIESVKPKISSTLRTSSKPSMETTKNPSTSKIEKVTFKPVHTITTPKNVEIIDKPIFSTKIKASLIADSNGKNENTQSPLGSGSNRNESKSTTPNNISSGVATKPRKPQKTNSAAQSKRPMDYPTTIEIEPIKVNAPVLRIEKIEDKESSGPKRTPSQTTASLAHVQVGLESVSNRDAMKTTIETSTHVDTTTTATRRPHKRKKNKLRRRKPTTAAPTTLVSTTGSSEPSSEPINLTTTTLSSITESAETELAIADNLIQESKIAPESKVTPSSGTNTKNKKKQVQKPIGTQIYNYLSREVMPSFGVMSLVGLGLGLASYFLYPFGGGIARRNYIVEPNYKYNMDEYGGNYGQSEEEVFSKVLQGMSSQDAKYGGMKDYKSNFYRYQQEYDGAYTDSGPYTTKKTPQRYSTDGVYRPLETTNYNPKYRNTDFNYPDVPTTANYYEKPKKHDYLSQVSGDRQFVVGNVPKEYGYEEKANHFPSTMSTSGTRESNFQNKRNHEIVSDPTNIENVASNYPQAEALVSNENYAEIEITPSAVAVEHGPRSLPSIFSRRKKRESVIQLIPTRTEIEKEEEEIKKEEPLSNEILDIIDSVIPEDMVSEKDKSTINIKIKDYERKKNMEKKNYFDNEVMQMSTSTFKPTESQTTVGSLEKVTEKAQEIETSSLLPTVMTNNIEDAKNSTDTSPNDLNATTSSSQETTSLASSTEPTVKNLSIDEILESSTLNFDDKGTDDSMSDEWFDHVTTTKPEEEHFNVFSFMKKIAEVKLRLGVAILKHASEGFARYLGHVQKRINGEE